MRKHFRPELLNRLDEIVVFDPLKNEELRKVARLQMRDVAVRLAERGIALAVTDAALDLVLKEAYDPVSIFSELFYFPCFYKFLLHAPVFVQSTLQRTRSILTTD